LTTPNQPNDERHPTNGVTERIAPSPIPPRPIPRPARPRTGSRVAAGGAQPHEMHNQRGDFASKASDQSGAEGGESFDQSTGRMNTSEPPKQGDPTAGSNGGGQSSYQDSWSQLPQREPQSNLYRPGQAPVTGRRAPAASGRRSRVRRPTRDHRGPGGKAARKEAAM